MLLEESIANYVLKCAVNVDSNYVFIDLAFE